MEDTTERPYVLWRIVSDHYPVLIASIYAFAAIVGTTYYAILLDYFDLAVLDYWDAGDILLAAFRQPMSLVLGVFAMGLALSQIYEAEYNAWLKSRSVWLWWLSGNFLSRKLGWKKVTGPFLAISIALFWFIVVITAFAYSKASDVWEAKTPGVTVVLSDEVIEGHVFSMSNKYVLMLVNADEAKQKIAVAIPIESIQSVKQCAERGGILGRTFKPLSCPALHEEIDTAE